MNSKARVCPKSSASVACALSILVLLVCACNRPATTAETPYATSPRLAAIDTLMWSRPDSAFALMVEHFSADSLPDAGPDRHYAHLLLAELLYKNDYAQTNRAELLHAVDYYDSVCLHEDSLRHTSSTVAFLDARAHYIKGVGYYETDSIVEACTEYLKTLEVMETHFEEKALVGHKARFMALTYNRLGDLFSDQFMMESAIVCYKSAIDYFSIEQTSPLCIPRVLLFLGKEYDQIGENGIAKDYYDQAIGLLADTNINLYRDLVAIKALNGYLLGFEANQCLETLRTLLVQSKNEKERLTRHLTIGAIFYDENIFDSALLYLKPVYEKSDDFLTKLQAADYLLKIHQTFGEEEKTAEYSQFLSDHTMKAYSNRIEVSKLEESFQNYLGQTKTKRFEKELTMTIRKAAVWIVLFVLIVGLAVFVVHRKTVQTRKTQQAALSGRLKQSNKKVRDLMHQVREKRDEQPKNKDIPTVPFYDEPICCLIINKVQQGQFKSQIDPTIYQDYALKKRDLLVLRETVNRHFNQFTFRLIRDYPKLTQTDLDYCCLYLLNLSDADVSALMQRAYNTVCERRQKIKAILGEGDSLPVTLISFAKS